MYQLSRQRVVAILLVLFILVGVLFGSGRSASVSADGNLLRNPGFEGQYHAFTPILDNIQVASDWTPWWVHDLSHNPAWAQPEYKPAFKVFFPERVKAGERAQQYFTFHRSHKGGMYQQVSNVTPGTVYRFSIWLQVWSTVDDNPKETNGFANPHLEIGIDPTGSVTGGGANGVPNSVVWSGEVETELVRNRWHQMTIEVTAQSSTIAVYVKSSPEFSVKHNDIYLDEAKLVAVGQGSQPQPTATTPSNGEATKPPAPIGVTPVASRPSQGPWPGSDSRGPWTPAPKMTPIPGQGPWTPAPKMTPIPGQGPWTPAPKMTPIPGQGPWTPRPTQPTVVPCQIKPQSLNFASTSDTNLLRNPGFEGQYHAFTTLLDNIQIADEWTPWWVHNLSHNPSWAQPEYKPAFKVFFPERVKAGERAQQYFTFHRSHKGGMYQQVSNVTLGTVYRFSIWLQVWSSVDDNPKATNGAANPHLQIGIDPTGAVTGGGANGAPASVVWSNEVSPGDVLNKWKQVSIEVTAQSSILSVYVKSSPEFSVKHNDIYLDEAQLVAVGQGLQPVPTQAPLLVTPVAPQPTPCQ